MENFQYEPLGVGEIRVLDILNVPGDQHCPLECIFRTTRLPPQTNSTARAEISDAEAPVGYTTISYVWGDPTPSRHLLVDGRVLKVPVNTEKLLRRVAHKGHRQRLWIDAVCINQQDLEERAEQVSLMGGIYGGSLLNIIWLGEGDPEIVERAIASIRAVLGDIRKSEYGSIAGYIGKSNGSRGWIRTSSPPEYDLDVAALQSLYNQPWFSRLWIVQEAARAPRNTCYNGDLELYFQDVLDAAVWSFHRNFVHTPRELMELPGLRNAALLAEIRPLVQRQISIRMGWLLNCTNYLQVSDERDRVFGMLGLITSETRDSDLLRPDYRKSAVEILRDAVKYGYVFENVLDLFQFVSHRTEDEVDELDRPSWVPMLHRPWDDAYDASYQRSFFDYKGRTRITALNKEIDPSLLSLDGIAVDEIGSLTPCLFAGGVYYDSDVKNMLDIAFDFADKNAIDRGRLARTLMADETNLNLRSTPSDWVAFEDLAAAISEGRSIFEAGQQVKFSRHAVCAACNHRKLAIGINGHVGLVPKICKPGDIFAVLRGPRKPIALRREGEHYVLLGQCYIDDVRDQEQYDQLFADRASEEKVFTLC